MKQLTRPVVISFFVTILLSSVLFLTGLGTEAYWDYDEAAYAHVTDQLSVSGDFLTMHYGRETWIDKPPFYFWSAYAARTLLGNSEFTTRLPAALGGILSVILVWLIVYELTRKPFVALFAGLILATTGAFLEVGRQARLDSLVTACILGAWYFYIKGKQKPIYYLGIGLCIGIGVMTKNVVGLLGVLPIVIDIVINKDFKILKNKYIWLSVILSFVVMAPWHLYEYIVHGDAFWSSYFFKHVVERYETNIFGNQTSVKGLLGYIFMFAMPWILFFIASIPIMLKNKSRIEDSILTRYYTAVISFAVIFTAFATSQTKAVTYFTAMYLFVAIAIGLFVSTFILHKHIKILLLLLVLSLPNAIDAGFHINNYYAFDRDIAEEERLIGQMLSEKEKPIYFTEVAYWETVRVYSGKDKLDSYKNKKGPYFLVAQNRTLQNHVVPTKSEKIFEGKYLSVFEVLE